MKKDIKKIILTLSILSLIVTIYLYVTSTYGDELGLCKYELHKGVKLYQCQYLFNSEIADFLFTFGPALFISLIPLFFTKEAAWNVWWKFAVVYLPISALIISNTPTTSSLIFGSNPREGFTLVLAGLFVIISFLIAIKKHFFK